MKAMLLLKEEDAQGVLRLTLNDVPRRNALSQALLLQLQSALAEAADNPRTRVIVLAAAGPVFCAGHDLKEVTAARAKADQGRAFFTQLMALCSNVMQAIVQHPLPVIAEVSGMATAAGCQLVASCDLAIASPEASFCTPGVAIGLFCSTPMVALSRNVSPKQAMEMLLTGEPVGAERAREIGLINRVEAAAELSTKTLALAHQIAARSGQTLAIGKRAFYAQNELPLAEAYRYASAVMVNNMLAADAQEGIGAFLEKRPPKWQDMHDK